MATSTLFSRFKAVLKKRVHKPPCVSQNTTNKAELDDKPVRKKKFRWSRFLARFGVRKRDETEAKPAGHTTDDPVAVQHDSVDQDVRSTEACDAEDHLEPDVAHLQGPDTPVSLSAVPSTSDQSFISALSSTADEEFLSAVSVIADGHSESVVSFTSDEEFLSAVSVTADGHSESVVSFTSDEEFLSAVSVIADGDSESVVSSTAGEKFLSAVNFRASDESVFQSDSVTTETAQNITDHIAFEERYWIGKKLGSGGFASVYEGIRKADNLKVALKYAQKDPNMKLISVPNRSTPVPLEVILALMASLEPACPYIVRLLDWQEFADEYVMVMEALPSCMDLCRYLQLKHKLDEDDVRHIMWQVVQAANVCCSRGVFHRDIKLENLLINTETQEVKLIDFGVGELMRESPYQSFSGTKKYIPPEFLESGMYQAKPATVYSLGLIMFMMLHGYFPSEERLKLVQDDSFSSAFSQECRRLMKACLEPDPERRIPLEMMMCHDWLTPVPQTLSRKKG